MRRRKPLLYGGDESYEVELGDEVEFNSMWTGPLAHCGEITAIYPRKHELRIRYRDEGDWTKKTCQARVKSASTPLADVTLIMRAM